jgi:hypothetical protein
MWRGGRDREGWQIQGGNGCESNTEEASSIGANDIEDIKVQFLTYNDWSKGLTQDGPSIGLMPAAPRLKQDLEAILQLVDRDQPQVQSVGASQGSLLTTALVTPHRAVLE